MPLHVQSSATTQCGVQSYQSQHWNDATCLRCGAIFKCYALCDLVRFFSYRIYTSICSILALHPIILGSHKSSKIVDRGSKIVKNHVWENKFGAAVQWF